MSLLNSVEAFLTAILDRFRHHPVTPGTLVISKTGTPFATRAINPIGNLAVARTTAELNSLKAAGTYTKLFDLTNSQLLVFTGSWQVKDVTLTPDPDFNRHTLIFSPHDGRFYYVNHAWVLYDVNLTESTP